MRNPAASVRLSERYTTDQLIALRAKYGKDSSKRTRYQKTRVEAIDWAIFYQTMARARARGETINTEGYSGRQSRRR